MRITLVIDDDLLKETFSFSQSKIKKAIIHEALREFIKLRKRKDLTALAGRIAFHPGFDHKALRKVR
jgi:hypothetical protein